MIAIIIPIESEGSSFFKNRFALVSPIPAKDAFDKNNHRNLEKELRKSLKIKCKNKKKFLGGGGQIYHIWTWPNLCFLGLSFSIFAHKKTTGKPVASKFKLNYSLTTLAACGPRAPSSTSN